MMVRTRKLLVFAVAPMLLLGCASVGTQLEPDEYCSLGYKNVRVKTVQNETIQAIGVSCIDSTVTLQRATYPGYDRHEYPLKLAKRDIVSMERVRLESLIYIESGVEHGVNHGLESDYFSETAFIAEIGYLSGERASRPHQRWGFGGTFYMLASLDDIRGGLKVRAVHRFNKTLSLGLGAGPMLNHGHFNGWVAGAGFNVGSYVTIKSEYMVFGIDPWTEYGPNYQYVYKPGGDEKVWYNGIALRNGAGWIATTVGSATLLLLVIASLGALAGGS